MLEYALKCVGMFLLAVLSAGAGLHPLAMALAPMPIAIRWARREFGQSVGLGGCTILGAIPGAWLAGAPMLHASMAWGMLAYAIAAGAGICLGVIIGRKSFGECVALLTMILFTVTAAYVVVNWHASREMMTVFVNARIAELNSAAQDLGQSQSAAVIEALRNVDRLWPYVNVGMMFGQVLMWSALMTGMVGSALRRRPAGIRGGLWENARLGRFRDVRPPDALVWLAIGLAVLWFVERRWPSEWLRLMAWNGAVGLSFVYWLNGLSLLVYAIGVMKWSPLLSYTVVLVLLGGYAFPILGVVGFFDTWWEIRKRLDRLAEARRLRGQPGGEE